MCQEWFYNLTRICVHGGDPAWADYASFIFYGAVLILFSIVGIVFCFIVTYSCYIHKYKKFATSSHEVDVDNAEESIHLIINDEDEESAAPVPGADDESAPGTEDD